MLDEDARGGRAGLPSVLDPRVDEDWQRAFEIRVSEDELRRLAAEFERDWRDMARRRRLHQRADGDRSGEGKMPHTGVASERRARLLPEARNDIERSGGKAGFPRKVGERERREAGFLRGFEHASVAHRARRAPGPPGAPPRNIPRPHSAPDPPR